MNETFNNKDKSTLYDTLIIGAGPAGLSAALYLLRAGKKVCLFEKEALGGQIAHSPMLSNFPGVKPQRGLDFINTLYDMVSSYDGFNIEYGTDIDYIYDYDIENGEIVIEDSDRNIYCGRTLILATGLTHKHLRIDNEEQLVADGKLSYCALCDGAFFKNKKVAVIGDGNSAIQYALELSNYCSSVDIIAWADQIYCEDAHKKTLNQRHNITIHYNFHTQKITELKDSENQLEIAASTDSNPSSPIYVDGVFVAIGLQPNLSAHISSFVETDEKGFILSADGTTNLPRIFAAGDCRTKTTRQAITAAADGAEVANKILNLLN